MPERCESRCVLSANIALALIAYVEPSPHAHKCIIEPQTSIAAEQDVADLPHRIERAKLMQAMTWPICPGGKLQSAMRSTALSGSTRYVPTWKVTHRRIRLASGTNF